MSPHNVRKVLLIEDDDVLRASIEQTLDLEGLQVISTSCFMQARRSIRSNFAGAILSDVRMPEASGFDVLRFAQGLDRDLPVILLTGHGDVPMATRAMKEGAYDFLEKPCETSKLVEALRRALDHRSLVLSNRAYERMMDRSDAAALHFPGKSEGIRQFRAALRAAAGGSEAIHIWGEGGLGKRTAAYAINQLCTEDRRFLAINCARATAEDYAALDQLDGEADLSVKNLELASHELLNTLNAALIEKPGVRLISNSTLSLEELRADGLGDPARRDEARIEIYMPPLSSRREDLLDIFEALMRQAARANDTDLPIMSPELAETVLSRPWTGNMPELRAFAFETVHAHNAQGGLASGTLSDRLEAFEKKVIENVLQGENGRVSKAAQRLGLPRNTLYDRMARFGLVARDYRSGD